LLYITMTQKMFPIKTATACQLKWSHSTVFLTLLQTASCHRVIQNKFDLETFDFHNTEEKLRDRRLMLDGQWPGHGCEHCKNIEDAGGVSDRILHLDFPGFTAPPELDTDLTAVKVTPRILEIYFSNTCNLKCVYCIPQFSSQINSENSKFGLFQRNGITLPGFSNIPEESPKATDRMFEWLESNIHKLNKLLILGGEPFIQKETQRLLDFLLDKKLPNLDLVLFSNLTIEHEKFKKQIDRLQQIKIDSNLNQLNLICSIDCWGGPAEYVRNGLDIELFEKNFNYVLHNTDIVLNINSTLGPLTIPTLPDLVDKINTWSQVRTVYWSLMKTGGYNFFHPTIFGARLLELGYQQAISQFNDYGDVDKAKYKEYFEGIAMEIADSKPDIEAQRQLKTYLVELDRRRNTNYVSVFPTIAELLKDIEI
jgi:organic radical activating enzyme